MKPFCFRNVIAALATVGTFVFPATHAASLRSSDCLSPAMWTMPGQPPSRNASAADIIADLARRQVVLLGEFHDDDDHHRWQVHTLAALHTVRPDMVIGFEMFPRRVQPVLDRWVAGELTLKQFLQQVEWDKVWNTPPELYVPLFQFARINRVPMIALNVDSALTKAVRSKGWDQVPEAQREGVGRAAEPPEAYRDFLFDVYRNHLGSSAHGGKNETARKGDSNFRNFVESQTTWDRAMAEALAGRVLVRQGSARPLAVGIVGSGHLRFGYGIPHQLRALGVTEIGTALAMPADADCKEVPVGLASAVFALPPQPSEPDEPPRLGVRLEEKDGAVRLAEVGANSLAEKTGLKAGDRLLEIGGVAASKPSQVAASIRRQPPGSWLPLRVRRGDETLDLVIKFPVKS